MFRRILFASFALLTLFSTAELRAGENHDVDADPLRLSGSITPLSQQVEMRLDPGSPTYSGSTTIQVQVHEPITSFNIHARELDITFAEIEGSSGKQLLDATLNEETEFFGLSAAKTISPGEYTLRLRYDNDFDTRARSLYKLTTEEEDYLFTQFEATEARGAFPCFDEPQFKIPWQLSLSVPTDDMAATNTPLENTSEDDGFVKHVFATTKPMPSYLIALAVGPFDAIDVPGVGVPCRVLTPKNKGYMAADAVRCTPPLVAALEDYFGRPYPYKKLDLVAVPEFLPGAMENVGLITFRDTLLLIDPEAATVAQKRRQAAVNAHELAHMWFGNLVTMEWWDDLWLNESFATWMGQKVTAQVYPEYGIAVTSVQGSEGAKNSDARESTRAIRAPVETNLVFESMDAGITYQKGEAVLGMFERFVGEDLFREGVRAYINDNEWSNATASDLFQSLSRATNIDFETAMSTFLDQPGVPNVSANVLGDGKVEFTQERFTNLGFVPEEDQSWQIPVTFKYSDGKQVHTQRVMLTEKSQVIDLPGGVTPEWIHPNADERGYYRWEIPTEDLFALVERSAESLEPRERVALVSHLSAQLNAGRIGGGDYLRATAVLARDPKPEVLNSALGSLGQVRFAFVTPEVLPAFRDYVRTQGGPALQRFGLTPKDGEDEAVNMVRPTLIRWMGRWAEDAEVKAYAKAIAESYLEDRNSVDASVVGACLSVAAIDGDWKLYNAYKNAFEEATVPAERQRFLGAMGDFGKRSMQQAALNYALEGPLRPQELFAIPQSVGGMSINEPERMWNWFVENYDAITERMPEMFKTYMPYFAGGCEEERLIAAREFFSVPEHSAPGQDIHLERVSEMVTQCADLRSREGQSVRDYLLEVAAGD